MCFRLREKVKQHPLGTLLIANSQYYATYEEFVLVSWCDVAQVHEIYSPTFFLYRSTIRRYHGVAFDSDDPLGLSNIKG